MMEESWESIFRSPLNYDFNSLVNDSISDLIDRYNNEGKCFRKMVMLKSHGMNGAQLINNIKQVYGKEYSLHLTKPNYKERYVFLFYNDPDFLVKFSLSHGEHILSEDKLDKDDLQFIKRKLNGVLRSSKFPMFFKLQDWWYSTKPRRKRLTAITSSDDFFIGSIMIIPITGIVALGLLIFKLLLMETV